MSAADWADIAIRAVLFVAIVVALARYYEASFRSDAAYRELMRSLDEESKR